MKLAGKIALVTGSSQGIGLAIAIRLAEEGADIVLNHFKQPAQAEALNFSAFYGDTDITHDPGTVGYGSPLHKGYYTRGLNHNVPLLNGEFEYLAAFTPSKPVDQVEMPAVTIRAPAKWGAMVQSAIECWSKAQL